MNRHKISKENFTKSNLIIYNSGFQPAMILSPRETSGNLETFLVATTVGEW